MIRHTHTDAKTATRDTSAGTQPATMTANLAIQVVPNQWIEMTADLPAAALPRTGARLRGRVLSIDAVRAVPDQDEVPGIQRVTTHVVFRRPPRAPILVSRDRGDQIRVRIPIGGGIDRRAGAHASRHVSQEPGVFPQRCGGVSAS
ncbi:MAG: hypothetical protein QF561_01935 [Phycisphaerales bacterium]|nr:hypothetical protein [Phycisphaerales bacterium]